MQITDKESFCNKLILHAVALNITLWSFYLLTFSAVIDHCKQQLSI